MVRNREIVLSCERRCVGDTRQEDNPVASHLNYTLGACYRQPIGNVNADARLPGGQSAANPDTGEPVKMLIADKNAKLALGKDYSN